MRVGIVQRNITNIGENNISVFFADKYLKMVSCKRWSESADKYLKFKGGLQVQRKHHQELSWWSRPSLKIFR